MTAVRLTAAQARALGLTGDLGLPIVPPRTRTTRKALPRTTTTTCHACGARFTGDTGEARHTLDTGHARYDTDIGTS